MGDTHLDGVKLSQLRALVAVANCGSFGDAALNLSISQSAVSHAIASLETELGVVLLSRGRHGARLTPVGERITEQARQVLSLLEQMGREANRSRGLEGGEVRVGCFRSVATHVLPEVIAALHNRYPAIAVTINECRNVSEIEHALRTGQVDIGFTCAPPLDEFESWELLRDDYVVLLPPQAHVPNDALTWEQLLDYPIIMPSDNDHCAILVRQHFDAHGQPLHAAYSIREDSTIVSMVTRGLGSTIMARLAAEPLPSEIQIRKLPVPLVRIISVALLRNALHSPAVFAFLDTLKAMEPFIRGLATTTPEIAV